MFLIAYRLRYKSSNLALKALCLGLKSVAVSLSSSTESFVLAKLIFLYVGPNLPILASIALLK